MTFRSAYGTHYKTNYSNQFDRMREAINYTSRHLSRRMHRREKSEDIQSPKGLDHAFVDSMNYLYLKTKTFRSKSPEVSGIQKLLKNSI